MSPDPYAAEVIGVPIAVLAAVITASVAVVLAVGAQVQTWRRDKGARAYERRRAALLDLQDAALELRRELRLYGAALRTAVGAAQEQAPGEGGRLVAPDVEDAAVADVTGVLEVRRSRLENTPLSAAAGNRLDTWNSAATEHFLSPGDVTAGAEQDAWWAFNEAVAAALA
jgi:hypothetical protein